MNGEGAPKGAPDSVSLADAATLLKGGGDGRF